jgi:Zn-dependent protease with chaperone function
VSSSAGPVIVILGVFIVLLGLVVWSSGLGWFGRLPGDIRIERESVRIYVPIVSMILVSIVLTLLLNLISRFF